MEIGLRIFALLLDIAIGLVPFILFSTGASWVLHKTGDVSFLLGFLFLVFCLAWPPLYLAIFTGRWGKTPGKLICRLSVSDHQGRPPGFFRALGREVLKCLSVFSMIGAVITLLQIMYQGTTWYDQLCGTQVGYSPPVKLTETQKNWRKYYKNR